MRKRSAPEILAWGFVLIPLCYVSTCSVISHQRASSFEKVDVGDSRQRVLEAMGDPSVYEKDGSAQFLRYASAACKARCAERFWYENHMSMDMEAWSVAFDASGNVIEKAHWVSP
jgi:outer membrane protein assembly factor BamE (lipoprotein component of BamABCDE complex)